MRKDLWQPMAAITFPKPPQGMKAYQRLREYRKMHELSWPLEDFKQEKNPNAIMSMKQRGKKLMDQKANSVADIAAVLKSQERQGEMTHQQLHAAKQALLRAHEEGQNAQLARQERERDVFLSPPEMTPCNAHKRKEARLRTWLRKQEQAIEMLSTTQQKEVTALSARQEKAMSTLLDRQAAARETWSEASPGSPTSPSLQAQKKERDTLQTRHERAKTVLQERHAKEATLRSNQQAKLRSALPEAPSPAPPSAPPSASLTPRTPQISESQLLADQAAAREALASKQAHELDVLSSAGLRFQTRLLAAHRLANMTLPARHAPAMELLLNTQKNKRDAAQASPASSGEAAGSGQSANGGASTDGSLPADLVAAQAAAREALIEQHLFKRREVMQAALRDLFWRAGASKGVAVMGLDGVRIRWASLRDAEMAESWPEAVVHHGLEHDGRGYAFPALAAEENVGKAGGQGSKGDADESGTVGGALGWIRDRVAGKPLTGSTATV